MRTSIVRSLQALVSLSAVVVLTGANDPGCMPSSSGEGSGGSAGGESSGTGGPPSACAEGTVQQWICGGPMGPRMGTPGMGSPGMGPIDAGVGMGDGTMSPPPPMPIDAGVGCNPPGNPPPCMGADCPPPPPAPGCVLQCVPAGNVCPAGFHQEMLCGPPPPPPMSGDPNTPQPSDAGVPIGMGQTEPGFPGDPAQCSTACVPDLACPPGTTQQTVCSGGAGMGGEPMMDASAPPPPSDGQCWNECVPVNPMCPPGTTPVPQCGNPMDPSTCMVICADGAP